MLEGGRSGGDWADQKKRAGSGFPALLLCEFQISRTLQTQKCGNDVPFSAAVTSVPA
jgi:hypothetical protein